MVLGLVRRVFGLGCFLLVVYAAVSVPIGRRTAWAHLVAIFTTQPAREAAEDVQNIARGALKGAAADEPGRARQGSP